MMIYQSLVFQPIQRLVVNESRLYWTNTKRQLSGESLIWWDNEIDRDGALAELEDYVLL